MKKKSSEIKIEKTYDFNLNCFTLISKPNFWPQLPSVHLHIAALLTDFYQLTSNIIVSLSFKPTKHYIVRNAVALV